MIGDSQTSADEQRSEAVDPGERTKTDEAGTHAQILKSSVFIGASTIVNVVIGMARTKIMALLLDPSGFGLMGLYGSIADLTVSVAGLGVNNSGVRQIAEAAGTGDATKIARTAAVLQVVAVVLGGLGALSLLVFSRQASIVTFGDEKYAGGVALLALAVFFRVVAAGQTALLQGLRRIGELAKINIFGALLGSAIGISAVLAFGEAGVAPALVGVAASTAFYAWWYSRKEKIRNPVSMTRFEAQEESVALIKLGVAFMVSGLSVVGAGYLIRLILSHELGLEAAGLYSSAWTLGGLYVGYILQVMGTDFYPQLVGVVDDDEKCTGLVNDQAQVSMLLAGPGIIATLTLAPLVISMFYSSKFEGAVEVLRWICLGMGLRIVTWPMGFIIVAKNKQALFLFADFAWACVNLSLAWLLIGRFGLTAAGIAFFGAYLFNAIMLYPIVRSLCGFRWTNANKRIGLTLLLITVAAFGGVQFLPSPWGIVVGTVATAASAIYSLRELSKLLSTDHMPLKVRRLLGRLKLVRSPVGS